VPAPPCTHLDQVRISDLPDPLLGCEECLEQGMQWFHLRMCLTCGHVGCCDNSEGRHASRHFADTWHALIRSAEPGEEWVWCYVDRVGFPRSELPAPS
jgi:uncharacterized UBP type Zn finger protein